MTRWIAAGAIGAAVFGGVANGWHNGRTHDDHQVTAPPPMSRDINNANTPQQPVPQLETATPELDDDLLTAEHEAGHGAAAQALGIPVLGMEIHDDGSGETRWADHYYRDAQRDAYDAAVIDVAGQESGAAWLEQRYGYTRERALEDTAGRSDYDLSQLRSDAARAGISETQARQRARDIIRDHRTDIDELARRLVDHGSLDEWELER